MAVAIRTSDFLQARRRRTLRGCVSKSPGDNRVFPIVGAVLGDDARSVGGTCIGPMREAR